MFLNYEKAKLKKKNKFPIHVARRCGKFCDPFTQILAFKDQKYYLSTQYKANVATYHYYFIFNTQTLKVLAKKNNTSLF